MAKGSCGEHTVQWLDAGREPVCDPDPEFPDGVDVDVVSVMNPKAVHGACKVDLDYPAPRCGFYLVECLTCGQRQILTTAGRRDDPRSVTLPCREPISPVVVPITAGVKP